MTNDQQSTGRPRWVVGLGESLLIFVVIFAVAHAVGDSLAEEVPAAALTAIGLRIALGWLRRRY